MGAIRHAPALPATWPIIVLGTMHALSERLDREPDAILNDALGDLLAHHEGKAFGGLVASQPSPDYDRPLIHARLLSGSAQRPLCGATDGPWSARAFDFLRLTCHECQALVLDPNALQPDRCTQYESENQRQRQAAHRR